MQISKICQQSPLDLSFHLAHRAPLQLVMFISVLLDALNGCREAAFDRFGAHVMPLYPSTTGGAHPVCTDVQRLLAAKVEGQRVVQATIGALLDAQTPA